jgi:hypothetical protein
MKKYFWVVAVLFVGVLVFTLCFRNFMSGEKVLLTTDAMIKGANVSFMEMVQGIGPRWKEAPLLGAPGGGGSSVAWMSRGFFSTGILWNNNYFGLMCLAAFVVLAIYFRRRDLSFPACICCALSAVWLGSNFTLLYPGHAHKPVVILFFICSLLPVARAAAGSVVQALIWGACIGLMFVQQPDVALFFALFAGAYFVFLLWKANGFKLLQWLKVLVPAAIVAFLFALGPLLSGYENHVKGTAEMQPGNAVAKWDYVTQWSIPPNEVIDFVAPGYYGWRSGELDGPYWGRTGQDAGWKKTKQGFRNFKLESTYMGIIPVGFAVFALFACRRSKHRAEILFWAGAALVSLMLAFGRYFPLYSLFYKLPVVNNIRNPNKFIQVFQLCVAILAAYGFDALWRSRDEENYEQGMAKPLRLFCWSSVGVLAIFGLWALGVTLSQQSGLEQFFSAGWEQHFMEQRLPPPEVQAKMNPVALEKMITEVKAAVDPILKAMVQNRIAALWHAVLMCGVMVPVFAVFAFRKSAVPVLWRNCMALLLIVLISADAVKLSRHYIKEMPRSYIEANALTDFLQSNLGDQRVAILSQEGINNIWITYLFPYNNIACFNYTDMPRMASDYESLLATAQRNPLNMWRFSGVKYVLAPSEMENQLVPAGCRKVFSYGLSSAGGQEFRLVPHQSGPYSVYELLGARPRYALWAGSQKVADDNQALMLALSKPGKVYLPEDSSLPVLDASGAGGTVEILKNRPGNARLKVSATVPSILRVAEKYDSDWKAKVDGKKVPVGRVDFLCQGVAIPAGEHEVELRYAPSRLYFNFQLLGCVILIGALLWAWWKRKVNDVAD